MRYQKACHLGFFRKSARGLLGITSQCIECIATRRKAHKAENKSLISARNRAYKAANKAQIAERQKAYCLANKKKHATYQRAYLKENKKAIAERANKSRRDRIEKDPVYAMKSRVRVFVKRAVRKYGYTKKSKCQEIIGCSWEQFQVHLEKQFTKGMSWDNRNQWHIDHIVPMATAKTESDVLALNHFTNLRPLWAVDNQAKSDTVMHLI